MPSCRSWFAHFMRAAASRTFWTAGSNSPIRMAMIAMTTSNSISVNARRGMGVSGAGEARSQTNACPGVKMLHGRVAVARRIPDAARAGSNRLRAAFARADADAVLQRQDEDLPVADAAFRTGAGGVHDR